VGVIMVLLLVSVLDQFAWVGRELPYKKDGGALHILWGFKKSGFGTS